MLDVLYIHPNASKVTYQGLSKSFSTIEPPIWALMLAKHSINHDYSVELIDAEAKGLNVEDLCEEVHDYNPKLVCIVVYGQQPSASAQNMQGVHEITEHLKTSYPHYKILLVGLYPSAIPRKTITDEKVDFVCQGEGPRTINQLLQVENLNDVSKLSKVQDLWYRDGENICFSFKGGNIANLDEELPGFAWELIDFKDYRTATWHSYSNKTEAYPFASIYTSLGCPYKCNFCCINAPFGNNNVENTGIQGKSFRYWSPEFTIQQFDYFADHGIKNIKIADEMFVYNPKHFLRLANLIIEREYDFNIWAYSRVDTIKQRYLNTLKEAGFNWLALGIESGSRKVRRDVTKGNFEEVDISAIVSEVNSNDIHVGSNFIFGLPEDNLETMQQTLDLAIELNTPLANFYCAMAYPGSQLYVQALVDKLELPKNYSGFSQHSRDSFPLNTKYLHRHEVLKFRDEAFITYHTSEKYIKMLHRAFGDKAVSRNQEMLKIGLKRDFV